MITVLQLAGGFVLLLFGAEFLVRGAVSVARRLKVAPMIIGMTIVAYGTTSPELVVSLQAAYDGLPGISVGNVVGSNICNILLILGTSALIFPIAVNPRLLYRDATMMMGAALLFTALALSGTIERWQGGLMIALLVAYTLYAFQQERVKGKANDPGDLAEDLAEEFETAPGQLWLSLLSIAGGVVAVVTGAKLLIGAAMVTARFFGVGEEVIGLTIVAVGTSLPEFATAVVAPLGYRRRQHHLQSPDDHGIGRRGDADSGPGADPRLRSMADDRRDRRAASVPAAEGRPEPSCRRPVPGRLRCLHGRAVLRRGERDRRLRPDDLGHRPRDRPLADAATGSAAQLDEHRRSARRAVGALSPVLSS